MDNNGVGVETGGRWGGLGVRLVWGEKAENCTRTTIKLEGKKKNKTENISRWPDTSITCLPIRGIISHEFRKTEILKWTNLYLL